MITFAFCLVTAKGAHSRDVQPKLMEEMIRNLLGLLEGLSPLLAPQGEVIPTAHGSPAAQSRDTPGSARCGPAPPGIAPAGQDFGVPCPACLSRRDHGFDACPLALNHNA